MGKAEKVIEFYMYATTLKNKLRSGWVEIGISQERIESVSEHISDCLMLASVIMAEYELYEYLDPYKVLLMLTFHETEEIIMPDYTATSKKTREERDREGRASVEQVASTLSRPQWLIDLCEEFRARKTKEAIFCYYIDKLQCDFHAKLLDLEGCMDYDTLKNRYPTDTPLENASDYWIGFDEPKFKDSPIFKELIEAIKGIDKKQFQKVKETIERGIIC